ncbi:hypothetical protein MA16_Dca021853 [Dendrobium catenatum]|uniref:Uncharacterized protein n=1 Tax=Dendrobium catenatum TaxID=906689 RepID=A0A2I0X6A1_9ASPA|nr:hypothetical protein MA16_Dca021853 [Dendrobium catenatum]
MRSKSLEGVVVTEIIWNASHSKAFMTIAEAESALTFRGTHKYVGGPRGQRPLAGFNLPDLVMGLRGSAPAGSIFLCF